MDIKNIRDKQIRDALMMASDVIDPNNRTSRDYGEDVKRWREERGKAGRKKNYNPWADPENMYTHPSEERHDPKDPLYHVSPEEFRKGAYGRGVYALRSGGRAGMATGGDPTDAYISSLYQNVMGRQADPEGQAFWRQQLEEGNLSQADILRNFAQSPEFQNLYKANPSQAVNTLYQTALGRAPDPTGLDFWTQQAQKGLDLGQIVSGFTESEEGQTVQDINKLYQDYFGNIATPDQIQSAQQYLNTEDWGSLIEKTFPVRDTSEEYDIASNKGGWKSIATPVPQSSEDLQAHFGPLEKQYNLPPGTLLGMMGAESTYGANQLNSKGYKGAFQFGGDAIREYNRAHPDAPLTSKNIYDWKKAADAAAWYAAQNADRFREKTGRDPLANELYNMHQQGFGGYTTIAANPKMKAVDALDKIMGRGKAIASIKYNLPPSLQGKVSFQDVTGEEFVEGWRESYKDKFKGPDNSGVQAISQYYGVQPDVILAGGTTTSDLSAGIDPALLGVGAGGSGAPVYIPGGGTGFVPGGGGTTGPADISGAGGDYTGGHGGGGTGHVGVGGGHFGTHTGTPHTTGGVHHVIHGGTNVGHPTGTHGVGSVSYLDSGGGYHPGGSFSDYAGSHGFGHSFVGQHHVPYNPIALPGAGGFSHGHHGGHGWAHPDWFNSSMHSGGEQSFFKSGGAVKEALRIARAAGGGAWTRKEGKNPEGGLNEKGRASLRAQGHDIKRPQPEGGARRDSFCARMKGMKAKLTSAETANDPDSRINKSLRKWNCADGGAIDDAIRTARKSGGEVWDKPRPKSLGKPDPLTSKEKSKAKRMAKAAGRPYPNLIDNMRAARADGGPINDALRIAKGR